MLKILDRNEKVKLKREVESDPFVRLCQCNEILGEECSHNLKLPYAEFQHRGCKRGIDFRNRPVCFITADNRVLCHLCAEDYSDSGRAFLAGLSASSAVEMGILDKKRYQEWLEQQNPQLKIKTLEDKFNAIVEGNYPLVAEFSREELEKFIRWLHEREPHLFDNLVQKKYLRAYSLAKKRLEIL